MSTAQIIQSVIEIAAIVFVLFALFHEEMFAKLERKLFSKIKEQFKKITKWVIG